MAKGCERPIILAPLESHIQHRVHCRRGVQSVHHPHRLGPSTSIALLPFPLELLTLRSLPHASSSRRLCDCAAWTDGKALFACGSPFPPVDYKGQKLSESRLSLRHPHPISFPCTPASPHLLCDPLCPSVPCQANNMYTFPGIGLGALSCQARTITDAMIYSAAKGLASTTTDADFAEGRIFPRLSLIPQVSEVVALAVCKQAMQDGVAKLRLDDDAKWMERIRERKWEPGVRSDRSHASTVSSDYRTLSADRLPDT